MESNKEIKKLIKGSSILTFAKIASKGRWQSKPHLVAIILKIYELLNTDKEILIINMPPRHGKSELLSKYFPAWYLLNNPSKRIIFTTYSDRFSEYFGRFVQDLYYMFMAYFGVGLYQRKQSANEWVTSDGGGMVSTGAGGSLTGRGADLMIIDDPIKNVEQALSKTTKENLNDWFYSTALTRLEPGGKVILIMTRWQPDDLTGMIIEKLPANKIIQLSLPAIAENNEKFRKKGEALWSERYSLSELKSMKEKITLYWFNAMYQQNPSTKGAEYININDFGFYQETETHVYQVGTNQFSKKIDLRKYATVDLAISTKQSADYTVVIVFHIDLSSNIYIENVIRKRVQPDKHEEFLQEIYEKYQLLAIGIEKVAYQETVIRRLLSKGVPVYDLVPDKDKLVRLIQILPFLNDGKIFLKENSNWQFEFLKELQQFPYASHDDQVDAFSYIVRFMSYQSNSVNNFINKESIREKRVGRRTKYADF